MHKAALKGDWEAAERLLANDITLGKSRITEGGETSFHIAALEGHAPFVANLLEKMGDDQSSLILEIQNQKGNTALSFAAVTGHVRIAFMMVEKNRRLPTMRGSGSVTPLYMATLSGHHDMVDYLFPLSEFEKWNENEQIGLLTTSIASGLYGEYVTLHHEGFILFSFKNALNMIMYPSTEQFMDADLALRILRQNNTLAGLEDGDRETPLQVLARTPSAFPGPGATMRQGLGWIGTIARTC